jgi:hypothetical protein
MNDLDRLSYECVICQIHVNRLELAINRTQHLYPFNANILEKVSEEELGFLEIFSTRFSKLQDALGEKVFSLLLKCLGEDVERKSFIDKLNKLEKLEHNVFKQKIVNQYQQQSNAYYATARIWDDGIIDPLNTRMVIASGLSICANTAIKETNFGIFRI